jgi:large subunit ribosomal protein L18
MAIKRKEIRRRIHARIRKKLAGTTERPRLAVSFSNRNVYAQIIDDSVGKTLAAATTLIKKGADTKANMTTAAEVGKQIAERAKAAKVTTVVFDRGGFQFHGKVKALADAAREAGLQF